MRPSNQKQLCTFGIDKYVSANWTVSDILTRKMVTPSCQYSHTLLGENNRGIEQCKILQQDASELFFFHEECEYLIKQTCQESGQLHLLIDVMFVVR